MRIEDSKILATLSELGAELRRGVSLAELTSLGIGGTTDLLRIRKHEAIPGLLKLLDAQGVPHKFLGGGSNLLVVDGELPFVVLQLVKGEPEIVLEGNVASVDAAADLGRTVTFCAKNNLGGMEGLIGVPGTVGGALRMNAGAYGIQIGSYVREVKVYRAAERKIEILHGKQISFEYRHTSFAPDDMMLAVKLELPSKPYPEILQGIRICNEKRRSSQPLGQKSAGCIFKNPPGGSAGRPSPIPAIRNTKNTCNGMGTLRRSMPVRSIENLRGNVPAGVRFSSSPVSAYGHRAIGFNYFSRCKPHAKSSSS